MTDVRQEVVRQEVKWEVQGVIFWTRYNILIDWDQDTAETFPKWLRNNLESINVDCSYLDV